MLTKEAGHCEYFAYSYTLLARAATIRPVLWWICLREWDTTESWTNEKTDAHARAEVFDGNK